MTVHIYMHQASAGDFPWSISRLENIRRKILRKLRPVIDDLKIRASIGQTGTEKDVKLFDYLSGYNWNQGNAVLDGEVVSGLNQRGLPVTNLSWTKIQHQILVLT